MKVKLKVSRAGQEENGQTFSQAPGDIIDVDEGLGQRMIDAGQAVLAVGEKPAKPKPAEKPVEDSAGSDSGSEGKAKPAAKGKRRAT